MYQLPRLKTISGLIHGFSEVADGNMSFRRGERQEALMNRGRFLNKLAIKPDKCVAMSLEHSVAIASVDSSFCGRGMSGPDDAVEADCLMTKSKNAFLFLLTGDCLPIIFYDPVKELIALAHLSRINTPLMFSRKIAEQFEKGGSRTENIIVGIGPGVRKGSYTFAGEELEKRISGHNEWKDFLVYAPNGKTGIDLVGYNVKQLVSCGVAEKNIEIGDTDSIADKRFFSHYRSRESGGADHRMATVVGMR